MCRIRQYRFRPTHFLSLPLQTYSECTNAIVQAQETIKDTNILLSEMMIPASRLHLSLGFFHINSNYEKQAIELIAHVLEDLGRELKVLDIHLSGIKHFPGNRVIFTSPDRYSSPLYRLKDCLDREFGLMSPFWVAGSHYFSYNAWSGSQWTPHVTLAKTSQVRAKTIIERNSNMIPRSRNRNAVKIPPSAYSTMKNLSFGVAVLDEIQLCSMKPETQRQLGYSIKASVCFSKIY